MPDNVLTLSDIRRIVKPIAEKYHIGELYVFGSFARNEATAASDIDFLVFGGEDFRPSSVFAFAEEMRTITGKDVDAFEISEINRGSAFYETVMRERVKVA